jgi:hypothetical protein
MKHILFLLLFAFAKSNAQGDCKTAVELLNKETIKVKKMTKGGSINEGITQYPCFENRDTNVILSDINTYWYTWECTKVGNFYFTIIPNGKWDDLDFVVFLSKNEAQNCTTMTPIRCMAAGSLRYFSKCLGMTGLEYREKDYSEMAGCEDGQNNFLKAIDMTEGERCYLYIKNTTSANGFKIKFYGDALIGNETEK